MASEDQLKAFREIAMNLYLGRPTVTPYYRSKLKTHKTLLQSLADRSVDNKDVKSLLRRHPEAISLILKPHWKDNGRRIRSGEKNHTRSNETPTEWTKRYARPRNEYRNLWRTANICRICTSPKTRRAPHWIRTDLRQTLEKEVTARHAHFSTQEEKDMDQVLISLLYIFYKKKDTKPPKPVTNNFYMYLCILLYNKHKQNKYRSGFFF